jgi:hypothetical protein
MLLSTYWRSECIGCNIPTFFEHRKVSKRYSVSLGFGGENGEDRWIKVVLRNRSDGNKGVQIVFVWNIADAEIVSVVPGG